METIAIQLDEQTVARLRRLAETQGVTLQTVIQQAIEQHGITSVQPAPGWSGPPRVPGLHAGAARISDDFDDPLPDDFWAGTG
jgi:hypothetical protein